MTGFVLDASVALTWCFRDETTPQSVAVLDRLETEFAVVPAIWPLEIANVLTLAERRGRIGAADLMAFVAQLQVQDIRTDAHTAGRGLGEILDLARQQSLTAYDAAYLELAWRERLALATRDAALIAAARRVGVAVIAA